MSDAGKVQEITAFGFKRTSKKFQKRVTKKYNKFGRKLIGKGDGKKKKGPKKPSYLEKGAKVVDAKGKIGTAVEIGTSVVSPFLSEQQKKTVRKHVQKFKNSKTGRAIKKAEPVVTTVTIAHGTATLAHKVAPKPVKKRVTRAYRKFERKTVKKISKSKAGHGFRETKKSATRTFHEARTKLQSKQNSGKNNKKESQKKANDKLAKTAQAAKKGVKTAAKVAFHVGKRFIPVVGQVITVVEVSQFAIKSGKKAFNKYASEKTKKKVEDAGQYLKDKAKAIKNNLINPKPPTGRPGRSRKRNKPKNQNQPKPKPSTKTNVHPRARGRKQNGNGNKP